jgi:uncharacterized membrane protein
MAFNLNREQLTETFITGAVVNSVLGGLGMAMVIALYTLSSELKTIIFWLGAISIIFLAGFLIQKLYRKDKFSLAVIGGGFAVAFLAMLIASPLASIVFPYLPQTPMASFQGPALVESVYQEGVLWVSIIAASLCLLIALLLHKS